MTSTYTNIGYKLREHLRCMFPLPITDNVLYFYSTDEATHITMAYSKNPEEARRQAAQFAGRVVKTEVKTNLGLTVNCTMESKTDLVIVQGETDIPCVVISIPHSEWGNTPVDWYHARLHFEVKEGTQSPMSLQPVITNLRFANIDELKRLGADFNQRAISNLKNIAASEWGPNFRPLYEVENFNNMFKTEQTEFKVFSKLLDGHITVDPYNANFLGRPLSTIEINSFTPWGSPSTISDSVVEFLGELAVGRFTYDDLKHPAITVHRAGSCQAASFDIVGVSMDGQSPEPAYAVAVPVRRGMVSCYWQTFGSETKMKTGKRKLLHYINDILIVVQPL